MPQPNKDMIDDRTAESIKNSRPFLKWAGGKTQLLSKHDRFISQSISRYFEPFLGGGALFFYLISDKNLRFHSYLSDINAELINVYKMIEDDAEAVIQILDEYQKDYNESPSEFYYNLRDNFSLHVIIFPYALFVI